MLSIHDIAGRIVTRLPVAARSEGRYVAHWKGPDRQGFRVRRGIYLVRPLTETETRVGPGAVTLARVE